MFVILMDKDVEDMILECHLRIEALRKEIQEEKEKIRLIFGTFIRRMEFQEEVNFSTYWNCLYYKLLSYFVLPAKHKIFFFIHSLYAKETMS